MKYDWNNKETSAAHTSEEVSEKLSINVDEDLKLENSNSVSFTTQRTKSQPPGEVKRLKVAWW